MFKLTSSVADPGGKSGHGPRGYYLGGERVTVPSKVLGGEDRAAYAHTILKIFSVVKSTG